MTSMTGAPNLLGRVDLLSRVLDWGERALLLFLYLLLVRRLWPSLAGTPLNAILILAETMVIGFVAFRRQTAAITKHPLDWVLALSGTLPPLFFVAGGGKIQAGAVAAGLMVMGILVQVSAKLFLRRSFGVAAANRGVKMDGPYRLVRHPMYLGYAITWIGFLSINANWRNLALILFALVMQTLRIVVEERLLKTDLAYSGYMARVRWRIIPGLF
jgi:protein-S-isoprenylcysteine O-methyltransferase Ste14